MRSKKLEQLEANGGLDGQGPPPPAGYESPRSKRLAKAAGKDKVEASDVDDEALKKAAAATQTEAPASLEHGKAKGAGNALTFRSWKKPE